MASIGVNNNLLQISNPSGTLFINPNTQAGQLTVINAANNAAFNPIVQANDALLYYSNGSLNNNAALSICSNNSTAIRLTATNTSIFNTLTLSGAIALGPFNPNALSNPPINIGIAPGTSDGATNSAFSLGIFSSRGVGFVDTVTKSCRIHFDLNAGQINSTTFNSTSDYRVKTQVTDLSASTIDMRSVSYLMEDKLHFGFLAHELALLHPSLVHGEKDGPDLQSINYLEIIPILVNDIKQLRQELKLLKDTLSYP
jgi:hypothetical protein